MVREMKQQRMSAEQALAVLTEYPDADLSAFIVDGDVEELAIRGASDALGRVASVVGPRARREGQE